MSNADIIAARAEVLLKRNRLKASVAEAKHRLSPATIATNVTDDLREKATVVAETGAEAVRRQPAVAAGIGAGLLAILFRKPLRRVFRRSRTPRPDPVAVQHITPNDGERTER